VSTGTHRRLQCLTETELIARELSGVYGIGKAIAEKAAKAGAKSVADLKRDPHKYGLSAATIKGLEHYDDLCERIPRAEVTELYESIKRLCKLITLCLPSPTVLMTTCTDRNSRED
jgi:NAD(P)-dependent dehydrogenase (short-subunit alcohol dehydrogenase family)